MFLVGRGGREGRALDETRLAVVVVVVVIVIVLLAVEAERDELLMRQGWLLLL